jgi:hypothetical protein
MQRTSISFPLKLETNFIFYLYLKSLVPTFVLLFKLLYGQNRLLVGFGFDQSD